MSSPVQPKKPRTRRLRRALAVVALGGLGLMTVGTIGGLVYLRTDDFQRRVVPLVSAAIAEQTGEQFDVDRMVVSVWPPAVLLEDAALVHPETGEVIVSAREVRAPLVLSSGGPGLGTLRLDGVRATLHIDKGTGLREFRGMKRGGNPLRRLPWQNLDITDTSLTLVFPDGQVDLTGLTVTPAGTLAHVDAELEVQFRDFYDSTAISWQDVQLGPTDIVIPDVALALNSLQTQGRAAVNLDGTLDVALSAHSDLVAFDALLGHPRSLSGTADVDVWLTGHPSDPVAEVTALVQGAGLAVPGAQVPVVHYRFGDVGASALVTKEGIDVIEALVCFRGLDRCHDPEDPDRVRATAFISKDLELSDGHVTAEGLSLAHILRSMDAAPNPWTDFSGDAEISVHGTLNPLFLEGPFDLAVANWRTTSGPVDQPGVSESLVLPRASARGNLAIYKDHLTIDAPVVRGPSSRGRANMYLGFGPKGPLDLNAELTQADLSDFRPLGDSELGGTGTLTGRLWGPFNKIQFDGSGDITDFTVIGIDWADQLQARLRSPDMKRIEVLDATARVGQTPYTGSYILGFDNPMWMDMDIEIPGGRVEDLVHLFLDLDGITGDVAGTLDLDGPLFDLDGEAHLVVADAELYGEHFDVGEGHGYMDTGLFTLDDLRLSRRNGAEGIVLRGGVDREWALDMEVVADGFALEHLGNLAGLDVPLTGTASLAARIDNTLFDPAPQGQLFIRSARYAGERIEDSSVSFETDYGVLRYTGRLFGGTVRAVGTLGLWGEQPYSMSAGLQRFSAGWLYPRGADGSDVTAEFTGVVNLDGNFGATPSPVGLSADLSQARIAWSTHVLNQTGPWHYEQTGDRFELTGIGLVGGDTRFTLTEGRGDANGIELRGEGDVDLDLLRLFTPGLQRSDGTARVSMSATGRGSAVDTIVDVDIEAELFRHESFPGSFEDIHGTVQATRDGYTLTDIEANLGGGRITAGGRIFAKQWTPHRWDLTTDARDVQLQWIDELPPAIGDAQLTFDGPVDALLLAGDVQINEMNFTDRIDWEDWVVEFGEWVAVDYVSLEEEGWFDIDVSVVADNTVTLRNNVAEGRASADLQFIGSTARPGMQGRVQVTDGVFFLQDREFVVDRGLLTWTDPWTWDPQLDFDLATDIRSRDTRYRVNYLVRGPFSNWRTETRSDPPLAQADINALLWFGATTDELEELGELPQALAQGVADFILTDLFITQGRGVTEEIRVFDRVELVTGVDSRGEYSPDPRLLVEKRYTDDVDITVTAELNPVQIDNQLVRAALRLSDQWSLSTWYASQQRDRVLSIGGAYGVDLRARWEVD